MKNPITNFNRGSRKYGQPLNIAIKNHEFKVAARLLQPKFVININAKEEDGSNALHFLMGHFSSNPEQCGKLMNTVLKKGIEVNLLNKGEMSPLLVCIKSF